MNRSNTINTAVHRTLVWAAAGALIPAAAMSGSAASAQLVPPDHTHEISGTPSVVRPGGVITFTGTCWWDRYFGAAAQVNVYGSIRASSGQGPFGFSLHDVHVDPADGSYSGRISVPGDAPEGDYSLGGQCQTEDQILGDGEDTFVVEGDPLPTTTTVATTTTTAPVTSTTVGGTGTGAGGTAPPAIPRPGTSTFTG